MSGHVIYIQEIKFISNKASLSQANNAFSVNQICNPFMVYAKGNGVTVIPLQSQENFRTGNK